MAPKRTRTPSPPAAAATVAVLACTILAVPGPLGAQDEPAPRRDGAPAIEAVELPSPGSPLVAVRLMFRAGSIHDPKGKEGLAALTALMVGRAGTQERSYAELLEALYPMAAGIDADTDREVTVLAGETHVENLDAYTSLLTEAVLRPAFGESDFARNKDQLVSFLTSTLRSGNDELLGLEALQQEIFEGHPYAHSPAGTVSGLEAITLDDVKAFHRRHFTRANLLLGVAGGYPEGYLDRLRTTLAALPAGEAGAMELPPLPGPKGRRFSLIEKETGSVGIHFGYAIPLTRADADYYPLMVANSFLGEHRTFNGLLMQELRGQRGLNYGDYSYLEYYAAAPFTSTPIPNVPRRQQYFSVWIRPVVPETAHFALRGGLHFVARTIEEGLTEAQFDLTRDYLVNYSKLWAQTLSERLGIHMDSRFYGMPYWIDEIERRLTGMTVEEVNAALKKYLRTDAYEAVMVLSGARGMAVKLFTDEPSPIEYQTEVPEGVLAEDEAIVPLPVRPTAVEIVPVAKMFE
ncbi:MAG TPA: pitrilysin family protein [Thermoanaerobaculia bacterium]|nr:pitrilysin family protein [Thermoanaerobaculia bacterium]